MLGFMLGVKGLVDPSNRGVVQLAHRKRRQYFPELADVAHLRVSSEHHILFRDAVAAE